MRLPADTSNSYNLVYLFIYPTAMIEMSGILDVINYIAVFQLLFFGVYLYIKGNKIYSTFFLKTHLFFQLISYVNYAFWTHENILYRLFLPLSMPSIFLWAPTFYFYIRSRLYINFVPSKKLFVHTIPAILMSFVVVYYLVVADDLRYELDRFGKLAFYLSKLQHIIYYVYTLHLIYRYREELKSVTSASEQSKLNWLLLITYGIAITTFTSMVFFTIPGFSDKGMCYFIFFIFLNLFFFKAILQPDQYLGIDEKKLLPVKLSREKSIDHFMKIDEMVDSRQLYLDPDLSLHNLSQAVKLSDRMVSQVIRQTRSLNFTDYINQKRISYAMEVLKSTTKAQKNVLEVLYESGFNSKSVFNTQFRKHTGMSPTEFREKCHTSGILTQQ